MHPDILRAMAVFVEVARLKGFTRAAAALGMPTSTVSRRISALERDIGLRLFKRTTQKVELTEEGEAYFVRCQRVMEDARTAHDELTGKRLLPRGHVRVAMTADFGLRLVAALPEFSRKFPGLVIEFDLTTRRVDPASENCDIAIHLGTPPDSGLTAIRLGEAPIHLYAAPAYLRGGKPLDTLDDLAAHDCILERLHGAEAPSAWTLHDAAGGSVRVPIHGALILNSVGLIRHLAIAGAGVALLPRDLCRADVEAGRLVRILDGWSAPTVPIHALTATRMLPAKTRAFVDFLKSQL